MKTVEVKEREPLTGTKSRETQFSAANIANFFVEIRTELKRMTWTSPEELRVYVKMVAATTFVMGLAIYVLDLFIQSIINSLFWFSQ